MTQPSSESLSRTERQPAIRAEAMRFAGMCVAINASMAAFKIGVGYYSGSHALLASALYSINDVLTSIAVAVSLRIGYRRATREHPYGYGKAEFIAAGMVSQIIALGVFFMFFFSVIDMLKGVPGPPHFVAMSLAAVSLVVSWVLSRRSHRLATALKSPVIATHSEHHHADAEGSLMAIIGVAGALMGFHTFDRVIAVLETLHLIALSGKLLGRSVKGLMDVAIPDEDAQLVEEACNEVDGVTGVAQIRSRQAGSDTWIDVSVSVAPDLTVTRARTVCLDVQSAVQGVLGARAMTQVRFQGPHFAAVTPQPGGSPHG